MHSSVLCLTALFSRVYSHGVILAAQGEAGSPASVGFQVDSAIARNCTGISPCQQDTTIIRDAEINANIVNECGRTELTGNIDVGENTENALAANAVTSVKAGTLMTVTIHQVNADGAGPYTCDLDQTGNAGIISQNLTVTNNVPGANGFSQAKTQEFNITVAMPDNLACTGASTGNVCTVRCRNNAVAGPFGGCFAVQQTDVKATANSANQITTLQTLEAVDAQIAQNQIDLPVAVAANAQAGTGEAVQGLAAVNALLGISVTTKASPVQTLSLENVGSNAKSAATTSAATQAGESAKASSTASAAASASSAATTKKGKNNGNGNTNSNGNANANANGNGNNNDKRGVLKWAKRMAEGSL